jgi:hypothetical protein
MAVGEWQAVFSNATALQAIYVRTHKNVLIQVNPHIRLPRTFKRFCGLMVQLLQKLSIRATNGPDKLLKVRALVPRWHAAHGQVAWAISSLRVHVCAGALP